MQGDVIGCFLHMPEGGRPMESSKEVKITHVAVTSIFC